MIRSVKVLKLFVLEILLSSNEHVYLDIRTLLHPVDVSAFESNPHAFEQVRVGDGCVRWGNGTVLPFEAIVAAVPPKAESTLATLLEGIKADPLASAFAFQNLKYLLPQFTFPMTKFKSKDGSEKELADHLVLVQGRGYIVQLKQKTSGPSTPIRSWFANKVLKKAKDQIKDSVAYLQTHATIPAVNSVGWELEIRYSEITELHYVICYDPAGALTQDLARHVESAKVGFIHIFAIEEYQEMTALLVNLVEIIEYLSFRQQLICQWNHEKSLPTERAMIGQFMCGDDNARPNETYCKFATLPDLDRFDLSSYFKNIERDMLAPSKVARERFLEVLSHFAILHRAELWMAKQRLIRCSLYAHGEAEMFVCRRFQIPHMG